MTCPSSSPSRRAAGAVPIRSACRAHHLYGDRSAILHPIGGARARSSFAPKLLGPKNFLKFPGDLTSSDLRRLSSIRATELSTPCPIHEANVCFWQILLQK